VPPTKARPKHLWLLFGAGVAGAVLLAELALRPLTTPLDNVRASIVPESASTEPREIRRFTEGFAVSHFTVSRARLTGSPPIPRAATGVILGDSYVEAVQVSDGETMGAVLERSLRAAGQRINVRQYGWSGVGIPKYVRVASSVTAVWDPVWVVVVITGNDLGPELVGRGPVRNADVRTQPGARPAGRRTGQFRQLAQTALTRSVLLYQLSKRAQEAGLPLLGLLAGGDADEQESKQPDAAALRQRALAGFSALRDEYGDRLRVLFLADVGVDGLKQKSPAEEAVLGACADLGIRCGNTRAAMHQDRLDSLRLSRGFINSVPGAGHINAVGHALAAGTIMRDLVAP
jgi:hypothetical protein